MFGRRARPSRTLDRIYEEQRFALELSAAMQADLQAQANRNYRDGMRDGVIMTLELLLGVSSHGGIPFTGERSFELEEWAQQALMRAKADA